MIMSFFYHQKKVDSLIDEEDLNDITSKLPVDIAGLVMIDIYVEEMQDGQGIFDVNVLSQMFHPSNIYLASAFKNSRKTPVLGSLF